MSEAAQARGKTVGEAACGFSETGWRAKVRWKSYRITQDKGLLWWANADSYNGVPITI